MTSQRDLSRQIEKTSKFRQFTKFYWIFYINIVVFHRIICSNFKAVIIGSSGSQGAIKMGYCYYLFSIARKYFQFIHIRISFCKRKWILWFLIFWLFTYVRNISVHSIKMIMLLHFDIYIECISMRCYMGEFAIPFMILIVQTVMNIQENCYK